MSDLTAWSDEIGRRVDSMSALHRDFHRHPKLSFQEKRTGEIIAERLHKAGLEVRTGIAGTGVVGVLRGERPGKTVAWRADIDALPLTEILDAPFASGTPGVMHACGDGGLRPSRSPSPSSWRRAARTCRARPSSSSSRRRSSSAAPSR